MERRNLSLFQDILDIRNITMCKPVLMLVYAIITTTPQLAE